MTEAAKKAEPDAAEQVEEVSERLPRLECSVNLESVLISLPALDGKEGHGQSAHHHLIAIWQ